MNEEPHIAETEVLSPLEALRKENSEAIHEAMNLSRKRPSIHLLEDGEQKDFEKTTRARSLFTPQENVARNSNDEAYLALPLFGINLENEGLEKLREALNDKRVLLVGGGRSMADLTSSNQFHPKVVVNVDPFLPTENIADRQNAPYYKSLPFDPLKASFETELNKEGYDQFDEIIATHSLPHYCCTPKEVDAFFKHVPKLIAPGGTLRIFPIEFYPYVQKGASSKEMSEAIYPILSQFPHSLSGLNTGEFRIEVKHYSPKAAVLLIHRLSKKESVI